MAFRRRFTRSRFGSRGRFRRGSGGFGSKKWIGHHSTQTLQATNIDALIPTRLETLPTFVPLVRGDDYGREDQNPIGSLGSTGIERQERTRVLRSIGHMGQVILSVPGENIGSEFWLVERWAYFCVLSEDDVINAALLDTASGAGIGTDMYNLGIDNSPPLWRLPIKKFRTSFRLYAGTRVQDVPPQDIFGAYRETEEFSWDFNPRARLSYPGAWYLVYGFNINFIGPLSETIPTTVGLINVIMARTLITD